MNFIRRLNSRGHYYFSNQSFQIGWLISGIEVRKTYEVAAQLGQKHTRTWSVNTTITKYTYTCSYHPSFPGACDFSNKTSESDKVD